MNPLYFGPSDRALFGAYHPAGGAVERASGVILCYPFAREYLRAHRAFRQLAIQLAREGFHVLRFDYYGTGDSTGSSNEADLDIWRMNISLAADKLKNMTGIARVSLVGLRLGATLAFQAAARRDDVDTIVLWNPIVHGVTYVEALLAANARWAPADASTGKDVASIWGFPMPKRVQAALRTIDLEAGESPDSAAVDLLVSEDVPDYQRLRDHLLQRGLPVTYRHVQSAGGWSETDEVVSALVPTEQVFAIVRGLAGDGGGAA